MKLFSQNLQSKYICDIIGGRGDKMEKDKQPRKVFTLRIPQDLHFQIEKSANEESRTLNSWFLNVAKQYLENAKK